VTTGITSMTTESCRKPTHDLRLLLESLVDGNSTMVDPDEAAKNESWWKDERYAIYDLSTNSATAFPAHDETLDLAKAPEYYTLRGYAYGGGGRRITRVQISIDQGKKWRLANIDYAEDKYRAFEDKQLLGGRLDMDWRETCFCWCFWDLKISVEELKNAKDIVVRAMDESMNVQPRDMYWSVLGMMNNPWFRIAIHNEDGVLRFEHPTQPALAPGGWMERVKKAGGILTNGYWGENIQGGQPEAVEAEDPVEIDMTNDEIKREISIEELRKHDNAEAPWFVVNGEVYDGTKFLEGHPGGAQSIVSAAGVDSSDEFMAIREFHPVHRSRNLAKTQKTAK
jgi:nitrate reductase (NAD(P)H)